MISNVHFERGGLIMGLSQRANRRIEQWEWNRFPKNVVIALAVAIVILSQASAVTAGQILVLNHSFEDPPQAPDSFTRFATSWEASFNSSNAGVSRGFGTTAPDGLQYGYAGNGSPGFLFQDLGVPVSPSLTYQLDVFVGTQSPDVPANYLIELMAGGTTIGSLSGTLINTPNFLPFSLVVPGSGSGNLGIKLSETGPFGQSMFDDVRLQDNSSGSAIPEPAAFSLLAIGGLTVAGVGYRRKRNS
jgi:hypothetical protein